MNFMLQSKHPWKMTRNKIFVHFEDLGILCKDIRTSVTYDYDLSLMYYMARKVIVYKTQEELEWLIILG